MKITKVVCGVIWKGKKVFIARRKPEKALGGYWEFPGGKIENDEEPEKALSRELKEELGMVVTIDKLIGHNIHKYDTVSIKLIAYKCIFVSAIFQLTDHDAWCFVSPQEIMQFKLAPADVFFIEKISNKINILSLVAK